MKMKKYRILGDIPDVPDHTRKILRELLNDSEQLIFVLGIAERVGGLSKTDGECVEHFYTVGNGKRSSKTKQYISAFVNTEIEGGRFYCLPQYFFLAYLLAKHPDKKDVFYKNQLGCSISFVKGNIPILRKHRRKLLFDGKIQSLGKLRDATLIMSSILKSIPDLELLNKLIREYRRRTKDKLWDLKIASTRSKKKD